MLFLLSAWVVWAAEGLDPAVVEDVLENRSGVLDCYADELGLDPYAAGHAVVTVTTGRYGKIVAATVEEQSVAGERFVRCMVRRLRATAFEPNTPETTIRHEYLFNSGVISHVIRAGAPDITACATASPPPEGGRFTMVWRVLHGEVTGARVATPNFEAGPLARCIEVRAERWDWDFSKFTSGEVRYAFRFVAAGPGQSEVADPMTAGASESVPGLAGQDARGFWGDLQAGGAYVRGNREVSTALISVIGGERWGDNELLAFATGEVTRRWHAHVRAQRWFGANAVHGIVGGRFDRFTGYDRRTQIAVGYTRRVGEDDDPVRLGLDAGLEYALEDYVEAAGKGITGVLGVRLAMSLTWTLGERFWFEDVPVLYQNLRKTGDRRLVHGVGAGVAVAGPVSVRISHQLGFDARPVPSRQGFDQSVHLGVVLRAGERPGLRWFDPLP